MGLGELFFGFSFAFTMLPVLLVFGLVVVMALQRDDDRESNRSLAIYAALIAFVGVIAVLVAAPIVASALVNFSRDTYDGGHDREATQLVSGAIAALVGAGILVLHRPLFDRVRTATGAAGRVWRAYALVMCFVAVLAGAGAAASGIHALFRAVAPDTFGGTSSDAARSFVPAAALLAATIGIGRWHWNEAGVDGEVTAASAP